MSGNPYIVRDQKHSATIIIVAWSVALLTIGYMLPWAIAATRGKSNHGAIAVITLLLGWTGIGWIVGLIMACGAHQTASYVPPVTVNAMGAPQPMPALPTQQMPPGWYPSPDGSGQQAYWNGVTWTSAPPAPQQA